jgi:predicted DNA-binding WGR domain protein
VVVEWLDPAGDKHRYYVVSFDASLVGDIARRQQWGRISSAGDQGLEPYADQTQAEEALEGWLKRRIGWRLRWRLTVNN